MADDLKFQLSSIEGEGPSPDFVAHLREQVVAEIVQSAVDPDDEFVTVIDFRPNEREHAMTKTRWILAGVAAAAIVLIGGFAALRVDRDEGKVETIDTPEESTPDTSSLTLEGSPLEAGTYRVETVGTPFTFSSHEELFVQQNSQAFFVLSDPASAAPGDRDMVFTRLTALWDPAQMDTQPDELGDGWPPGDFDGWLDNLTDGVVASNREETTLGGLDAIRVDLDIDLSACSGDPQFCVGFGINERITFKALNPGGKYRIWVIDQEEQAPLAVIVGINSESKSGWFDTAEEVLLTVEFGDIAPNPILRLPGGSVELPLLGGIRVELVGEQTISFETRNLGKILVDDMPADVEFLTNPLDLDGIALETSDDLVALLSENAVQVTELDSTVVGGVEAKVFEIAGRSPGAVLMRDPGDERGWFPPSLGQIWLVEHPERGLLMINAEAWANLETVFPLIRAQTEQILGSLEFIEIG